MNRSQITSVHRSLLAGLALAAVTMTACGGERPSLADATPTSDTAATVTASVATAATTDVVDSPTTPATTAAANRRGVSLVPELAVFDRPGGAPLVTLPATTVFGTPTVVAVIATEGDWAQVRTPTRPNELMGWVRVTDVRIEPLAVELHVSLTDRTLRFVENGQLVGEWAVAIGTAENPTPTGHFFVTDKLATGEPEGVYGSWAFGLSAFSETLTDFIGGIGQIGLHGTNNPSSIGQAASHGCIRLPNEVMAALVDKIPVGTPITIT